MLKSIKEKYQNSNTQFIIFDKNGVIIESDNTLLDAQKGKNISELHPFFENIITTDNTEELNFSCVHLSNPNRDLTCDISISTLEVNTFLITLTDFSKHYQSFQSLAQSRNETAIASEILVIKNKVFISAGLKEGDIIATAGVAFLRDGQQVSLIDKIGNVFLEIKSRD